MRAALQRLKEEGAVQAMCERRELMARLGSEDGVPKLDWVDGVPRLLENDSWLEEVEAEAASIVEGGIRHVIWSGMGGSVMTVRVLTDLGLCAGENAVVGIHSLDSTDPAALNHIVRRLAAHRGLTPPHAGADLEEYPMQELLADVMMIAVSMGMTSEEPITHLAWFMELLAAARLPADRHCLVMTLPDSYLERFATERRVPARPLQLDGRTGTGGRMSAPTTRVFLLPAALALHDPEGTPGRLRAVLSRAWREYDLPLAMTRPGQHPFVRLAAAMDEVAVDGACAVLLSLPSPWHVMIPWIEQLMEESLGKGGKGVMIFDGQTISPDAPCFRPQGVLPVHMADQPHDEHDGAFVLALRAPDSDVDSLLAAIAASFLGWQLTMALYGYLQQIQFAGQPAVEQYKARARELRTADPLRVASDWQDSCDDGTLTLLVPPGFRPAGDSPASAFAMALRQQCPRYLDLTVNGELSPASVTLLQSALSELGNNLLGVPFKLRRAPAAYHSTEQSEMDGPPGLISLRVVARKHEQSILGSYEDTFLLAQAVGTWQAMVETGRRCFLLLMDGYIEEGIPAVVRFLHDTTRRLRADLPSLK